jgi:hypothetical protein
MALFVIISASSIGACACVASLILGRLLEG